MHSSHALSLPTCAYRFDTLRSRGCRRRQATILYVKDCNLFIIAVIIIGWYVQYTYGERSNHPNQPNQPTGQRIRSLNGKNGEDRAKDGSEDENRTHTEGKPHKLPHRHLREGAPTAPWERVDMTRLHLCQYSSARRTRRCLRRSGRSGIGGVGEAAERAPSHRERGLALDTDTVGRRSHSPALFASSPSPQAHSQSCFRPSIRPFTFAFSPLSPVGRLSPAGPSRRQSKVSRASLFSQHRILIDQLSAVCQEGLTRNIDKKTNEVSN